jgi:DNA primase
MSSILDVLDRNGVTARPTGKASEYVVTCPVCAKPKLYVNVEKKVWVCYVCGDGGYASKLFKLFGIKHREAFKPDLDTLRQRAHDKMAAKHGVVEAVEEIHPLPDEFKPIIPGFAAMGIVGTTIYEYLLRRGMTNEQILSWKVGYCAEGRYRGCCIIPVTDKSGAVVTFQGRRVMGVGQKNANPPGGGGFLFNTEFAQGHMGIVVVEGPFDAASIHTRLSKTMGISSIALLRHSIAEEGAAYIARIIKPKIVWVGLDPDVENTYMHKVGGALRANGCPEVFVALFPQDPDELPTDALLDCLDKAKPARQLRK